MVAVNDAAYLAPWAQYLYARDLQWWDIHHPWVETYFHGERWTGSPEAHRKYALRYIKTVTAKGIIMQPDTIADGGAEGANSGYQAIGFALKRGAKRILLIGFDMGITGKGHFFGLHPHPLTNVEQNEYAPFAKAFDALPPALLVAGIQCEIVNCSRKSAIGAFRFSCVQDELL